MSEFDFDIIAYRLANFANMGMITTSELRTEMTHPIAETRSALARCGGCGATENVGSRCTWCRQVVN